MPASMLIRRMTIIVAAVAIVSLCSSLVAHAQTVRTIRFPADGAVTFTDDFGAPRAGHTHIGIDIMGKKMMPLLSAVDGYVKWLVIPEASWGYEIELVDSDGYTYYYIHVNNDTPGTDDGMGGLQYAYAPDILSAYQQLSQGDRWGFGNGQVVPVRKGQLIGWMGDSGDAENGAPHLHFEIHDPSDTPIDPYPSLMAAFHAGTFDRAAVTAAATSINVDRGIVTNPTAKCISGSRVKIASSKAVYYCGADGKRYVFPNDKTYYTWYPDFVAVTTVTAAQLAALPLGGNVTYRPGVKMVKIQSDPKVYAVDKRGTLRWVESPAAASALYGTSWAKYVEDVSDAFFINYKVGDPITN